MANLQQEIWKSVVGYEGLYEVSNFGRVKSLPRPKLGPCGRIDLTRIKIMRLSRGSRSPYLKVTLKKEGRCKTLKVHRMVAAAYLPNPENKPLVNHKDSDPSFNHVDNLEWCTQQENIDHCWKYNRGNGRTKPIKQLSKSGELLKLWTSSSEANRNGYTRKNIIKCCNGLQDLYRGCAWQFA